MWDVEEVAEFGEEELVVGAFGPAGGLPAGEEGGQRLGVMIEFPAGQMFVAQRGERRAGRLRHRPGSRCRAEAAG